LAGFDWGARTVDIVAALCPERCNALVAVSEYLIGSQAAGNLPLLPQAELQWWYQYYFATERGRVGYGKYRHDFAKLIWHTASPKWNFDDATFDRSAESFDNPDHVDIVIHNYRWRLGLAEGEAEYDALENRLAEGPVITVPAIRLEGDANGAPHPDPSAYAKKFTGRYSHRTIERAALGTTFPRKPRRPLPRPSSNGILISKTATDTAPLTVVFVHGAFADASSWNGVIQRVQAAGIQVTAPAIPLRGIAHDSAYVASFLNQEPGPVLAVGH